MMKKISTITLVLICCANCFSAALSDDPRTFPVLIAHDKGFGSGCFFQLSNSVYLVTAKHVLFAVPEGTNVPGLLSPTAVVRSFVRDGQTNVSERIVNLNLSQLLKEGEVRYSINRDIAVVRIQTCASNNPMVSSPLPGVTFLSHGGLTVINRDFICPVKDIDVGADVFMFGYPISLTGPIRGIFDPSEPLLRKGIVAGVNLARKTIIIDCPSYFGNSGGPVLQVEHPSLGATSFRCDGLVSGFIPFQEEWENKTMKYSHVIKSNSGYTVVEPIELVLELVWK